MFKEIPANELSISKRNPILGVGINDADYMVKPTINGIKFVCPYYSRWMKMLERCYSSKYQARRPTYIGCEVIESWLTFSNFKCWMVKQNWAGMDLDKDIINPGNKIYSPDNCRFIPQSLNLLLIASETRKGQYPQGVCYHKGSDKYQAQISIDGKLKHLGRYKTPEQAGSVYLKAKTNLILQVANEQTDDQIAKGLRLHVGLLIQKCVILPKCLMGIGLISLKNLFNS